MIAGQTIFINSALSSGLSHGSVALTMAGLFLIGLGRAFRLVAGFGGLNAFAASRSSAPDCRAPRPGTPWGFQGRFWQLHDVSHANARGRNGGAFATSNLVEMARRTGVPDLDRFGAGWAVPSPEQRGQNPAE